MKKDKTVFSFEKIKDGNIREASRLITAIEDNRVDRETLSTLLRHPNSSYLIGITGPPGVGKSSLINQLIILLRKAKGMIGVIAIDPSSPFSGGAILGDRIRMHVHNNDKCVFIRSMASRDAEGSVSLSSSYAINVMDMMGKDYIIIETIGSGQNEVGVHKISYTTVVVLSPDFGDDLQLIKSGLMEIGDIYVLNKSDRDESGRYYAMLKDTINANAKKKTEGWQPLVLSTDSLSGKGIEGLLEAIHNHKGFLVNNNYIKDKVYAKIIWTASSIIKDRVIEFIDNNILKDILKDTGKNMFDPYLLTDKIILKLSEQSFYNK